MARSLAMAVALASAAVVQLLPVSAKADRTLPMRFDVRQQGAADNCGAKCGLWISASGAITADTPRDFELFVQDQDRKSTRLNSSHANISYAVFCLKKKK